MEAFAKGIVYGLAIGGAFTGIFAGLISYEQGYRKREEELYTDKPPLVLQKDIDCDGKEDLILTDRLDPYERKLMVLLNNGNTGGKRFSPALAPPIPKERPAYQRKLIVEEWDAWNQKDAEHEHLLQVAHLYLNGNHRDPRPLTER
ncbi:MAG: hypothetical protein Q7R96_02875 [Nanoarchaeota archaeon]|nr:hypothetical protein [Nanoarchaeota archaeon]